MGKRSESEKLKLLDDRMHELIKRFYLRPSRNGELAEFSSSELFACNILGRKRRCMMKELAKECGTFLCDNTSKFR